MLLKHDIPIPIYDKIVYILIGDAQEVQDYLTDVYSGDFSFDPNTTDAICLHYDLTNWIWFDPNTVTPSIIVHELAHAVFNLMSDIGLDFSDQEAFCYLQEYLVKECANIFAIRMDPIKQV